MSEFSKALETLRQQINAWAPDRNKESDGTWPSEAHKQQSPNSDHNTGNALDITNDPASGVDSRDLAEQIKGSRDPRVSYLISDGEISNPDIEDWAWRPYTGSNDHTLHFHTSIKAEHRDDTTPWAVHKTIATGEVSVKRPVLEYGSTGPAVKDAQKLLGDVKVDGVFGTATQNSTKSFQASQGLPADGIIGPYTWRALLKEDRRPGQSAEPEELFEQKAPGIMTKLMNHFPMTNFQTAGVLGNIGHECAGFTLWQEAGQTPPAGGWGWCQWTGSRRTDFMAWTQEQGFAPTSDEGNYGFLKHELETTEKAALQALLATKTLEEATESFMRKFERPGVEHLDRRIDYANRAKAAFQAAQEPQEPPEPEPPPQGFPFPFPIPGLPTAPGGGFPWPFPVPGLPTAPPAGVPPVNLPIGDLFSVIARATRIMALFQAIPHTGMTVDRYLAGVEEGLTVIVHGPMRTVEASASTSLKLAAPSPPPPKGNTMVPNVEQFFKFIRWLMLNIPAVAAFFATHGIGDAQVQMAQTIAEWVFGILSSGALGWTLWAGSTKQILKTAAAVTGDVIKVGPNATPEAQAVAKDGGVPQVKMAA